MKCNKTILTIQLSLFSIFLFSQPSEYTTRTHAYSGISMDSYSLNDPGGKINDLLIASFSGGLEVDVKYSDVRSKR